MSLTGITLILIGVVYLIYSVLCRDKVTYYTRKYSRRSELVILKPSEFLRLQLYFSLLNAVYLIVFGILIVLFNLNNVIFLIGLLIFHFIHFLLIIESKNRGYVDYKVGKTYK